jgi:hypothetical protein
VVAIIYAVLSFYGLKIPVVASKLEIPSKNQRPFKSPARLAGAISNEV